MQLRSASVVAVALGERLTSLAAAPSSATGAVEDLPF